MAPMSRSPTSARPTKPKQVVAEIEKLGRRGLAIKADSANSAAVTAAVEKTATELKGLDILVNNAGIFVAAMTADTSAEDLERLWQINVRALIVAIQAAFKAHAERWPHHHDRQSASANASPDPASRSTR